MSKTLPMRPPRQKPDATRRRPPEPFRPIPAKQMGISLLTVKVHRKRHRGDLLGPRAQ